MDIPGYDITARLLVSARTVVQRARRRIDGRSVLLKSAPPGALRAERERELDAFRRLRLPGTPHLLDTLPMADGVCLVLADHGLGPLPAMPDLGFVLRCGRRLAELIGGIHQRDLALGALDVGSILTNRDGSVVEIVDLASIWGGAVDTRLPPPAVVSFYTSPEQTGRLNRDVDYRSDFYALGAVLYHLLTGRPPFSEDSLERIHANVSRTPVSPSALVNAVADTVSELVLKLLATSPEDRYQNARGLVHDLRTCEQAWADEGRILPLTLGERDVPDRFRIPQKLYGRERAQQALLDAFTEACRGRTGLVLMSGADGTGKTALIGELARPIALQHGYFTIGKFDQVVRDIPYGAVVQAFRGLVWQLLSESEERLTAFRQQLETSLGANVAVLAELVPEIEMIAGKQPPPHALDPAETQNRFRYVVRTFVGTIAGDGHPLVLVLDDLQWTDPATVQLVADLLGAPDVTHLLVIGACSKDIGSDHPLRAAIDQRPAAGAHVRELPLAALDRTELTLLLHDTLRGTPSDLEPFADLLLQKTDGNPFFVTQFLVMLEQEGRFYLDAERGRWAFDVEAIARAGTTTSVSDLMTRRLRQLSPAAQQAVTLAACIGNQFELDTFVTVSRQSRDVAAAALREAIEAGLIHNVNDSEAPGATGATFAFLHDQVQQSACDLIAADARAALHLAIGRMLLAQYPESVPDDRLFEVVSHLSAGRERLTNLPERSTVARLCLAASRKAKRSAAFQVAVRYAGIGLDLLPPDRWTSAYQLTVDLHLESAECQHLTGAVEAAGALFQTIVDHAQHDRDRGHVFARRLVLYQNLSRFPDALASGRAGLALFGITFPDTDDEKRALLDREVGEAERDRADRPIASLVNLPVMTDEGLRLAMRLLTGLWTSSSGCGDHALARLISVRMVRLSLAHGNTEDSAYGYVTHAITIGPVRHEYRAAYEWGALGLAVNERLADPRLRARIHQEFQTHVNLWRRPFATCLPHAREARRGGLEGGDFTYAAYGAVTESWPAFLIASDLEQFVRDFSPTLAFLDAIGMNHFRVVLQVMLDWARELQDRTVRPLSSNDGRFDETPVEHHAQTSLFLTFFYTARLHLALVFDDRRQALDATDRARQVAQTGTIWPVLIDAWGGLATAAAWEELPDHERTTRRGALEAACSRLRALADNAPENFRCLALMLEGERARIDGYEAEAAARLDEAIAYARQTGVAAYEAMAGELAGRLWLQRGRDAIAAAFIGEARRCYDAMHAAAKVAHLDERYGTLLATRPEPRREHAAPAPPAVDNAAALDVGAALQVAHALAAEMDVAGLLRKLMRFALENAGAQRGVFLQDRDGTIVVEAEASADADEVTLGAGLPLERSTTLAQSLVRYVRRTGQGVVIGDAASDERVAGDPYVEQMQPKAILCVPVEHQGRLRGLLYLENTLAAHSFTPGRIETMRLLAAQTAISLESARLYAELKHEVSLRATTESSLREAVTELEALKDRLEAENGYLQEEIRTQHNFDEIVGNSPALLEALRKVERVAPTETTVLIVGETGSGKELFARAVHSRSGRRNRPLIKVNCGAIAPGLVESELFGHVKGAFPGAGDKRVGRFELADGGTIFLDEVGELPRDVQTRLLRVLQEQEFAPAGGNRTVRLSVRVIATTNRDLEQAVRVGRFRADLLDLLNVCPIEVPPLRARGTDIALLASFFVSRVARRVGKPLNGFSSRSMDRILEYGWPGNVRELQNMAERAAILAEGPVLEVTGTFLSAAARTDAAAPPTATLDEAQRRHIINALKASGGVVEGPRGAAIHLAMHPNTLRSRMKKLGIHIQNL